MRPIILIAALLPLAACTVEGSYSDDRLTTSPPCKVAVSGLDLVADIRLTCRAAATEAPVAAPAAP
jgi:hypothetical protein